MFGEFPSPAISFIVSASLWRHSFTLAAHRSTDRPTDRPTEKHQQENVNLTFSTGLFAISTVDEYTRNGCLYLYFIFPIDSHTEWDGRLWSVGVFLLDALTTPPTTRKICNLRPALVVFLTSVLALTFELAPFSHRVGHDDYWLELVDVDRGRKRQSIWTTLQVEGFRKDIQRKRERQRAKEQEREQTRMCSQESISVLIGGQQHRSPVHHSAGVSSVGYAIN